MSCINNIPEVDFLKKIKYYGQTNIHTYRFTQVKIILLRFYLII